MNASESAPESNEDIFARVYVSKNQAYIGEPIYASVKIYTQKNFNLNTSKMPDFNGFYKKILEQPQELKAEREVVNGKEYQSVLFQKLVLYPQKSGKLIITPFKVDCNVITAVGNSFWNMYNTTEQRTLSSKAITINVLPFPAGKTCDFTGAVGNFSISSKTDVTEIPANEAITFRVTIQGIGNLALIQKPIISFPPDFEMYDPKVIDSYTSTTNGDKGSKTFEYLIIPRHEGNFVIPSIKFQYFNTASKSYKTLQTAQIPIRVTKGSGNGSVVSNYSNTKEKVKYFGEDIHFIKTGNFNLQKNNGFFYESMAYNLLFIFLIIAAIVYGIVKRKQIEFNQDVARVKNRKANKESIKRLKKARICLEAGNDILYYDEVAKALWGYLSDKFTISQVDLNSDIIRGLLEQKQIEQLIINELVAVMTQCEFARYAPPTTIEGKELLYSRAASLIQHFEQKTK
jgi:hypothetical protein